MTRHGMDKADVEEGLKQSHLLDEGNAKGKILKSSSIRSLHRTL